MCYFLELNPVYWIINIAILLHYVTLIHAHRLQYGSPFNVASPVYILR